MDLFQMKLLLAHATSDVYDLTRLIQISRLDMVRATIPLNRYGQSFPMHGNGKPY